MQLQTTTKFVIQYDMIMHKLPSKNWRVVGL